MKLGLLLLFLTILVKAQLICENTNECPESVGQLKIKDDNNKYKVCTGFLVKEDVVATNLHCIPDSLQKMGASCSQNIKISFPNSHKDKPEANECDKVLFLSAPLHQNKLNVDLALLKFKKAFNGKVLKISQDGFPFNTSYNIYKIDPTTTGGILKKINCLPKPNTVLNPYYVAESSPIINLNPCVAVSGNSGSPILSLDGYVRGMLSSGGGIGVKDIKQEMNTIFGSNFSCVDFSMLGYPSRNLSSCDTSINPENENKLAKDIYDKANTKLLKLVEEKLQFEKRFMNSEMRVFKWNLISNEKNINKDHKVNSQGEYIVREIHFSLEPKCISFKSVPLDFIRKKVNDSNQIVLSFELPEFVAKNKIAEKLDMNFEISESNKRLNVRAPMKDFLNNQSVRFDVEGSAKADSRWELPVCE